jgi:2-polyprenyl-6-methoxyphenol hydroxylase-like FAD-dependent oxidoreductase
MVGCDIAVVGGGLAGSAAAALLARAGFATVIIDPFESCRPDFRLEKFDERQIGLIREAGLLDIAAAAATRAGGRWVARCGRLVDRIPRDQLCFRYETMVDAMRAEADLRASRIVARAVGIDTGPDRQRVRLGDGSEVDARLVILATGLNLGLQRALGLERRILSPWHSISIGFDVAPRGGDRFAFPALTYFSERSSARTAYLALFPIGEAMRANLFVYRDKDDPWLAQFRREPETALDELLPRLARLTGGTKIIGPVRMRPVDLYATHGHRRPGAVLVGDAYSTSCPAAGTGADKVFTDINLLCRVHIPAWFATPGMGADKIARFYDDPVKRACEKASLAKAFQLRAASVGAGPGPAMRRWTRFVGHAALGLARRLAPHPPSPDRPQEPDGQPLGGPGAMQERAG